MNNFKKTVIALATVSTLAVAAAAPAHAGWKNNFGKGLAVGAGIGIAAAILAPRQNTVVYAQQPVVVAAPSCGIQNRPVHNAYGQFIGYQQVQVCY